MFNDKAAVETLLKKGEKRIEQNHFTETSLDSASRQFLDNLKKRERLVDGKVLS